MCVCIQVVELLNGAGVNGEVCKVIGECVSVRQEEVRTQLLRDSSKVTPTSLTDFDWKLKVSSTVMPKLVREL